MFSERSSLQKSIGQDRKDADFCSSTYKDLKENLRVKDVLSSIIFFDWTVKTKWLPFLVSLELQLPSG